MDAVWKMLRNIEIRLKERLHFIFIQRKDAVWKMLVSLLAHLYASWFICEKLTGLLWFLTSLLVECTAAWSDRDFSYVAPLNQNDLQNLPKYDEVCMS